MCVNRNCDKDPLVSVNAVCVSGDGDFACDTYCKREYEKQRSRFFNDICHSEILTERWLMGEVD